jgi:hypothetical protein
MGLSYFHGTDPGVEAPRHEQGRPHLKEVALKWYRKVRHEQLLDQQDRTEGHSDVATQPQELRIINDVEHLRGPNILAIIHSQPEFVGALFEQIPTFSKTSTTSEALVRRHGWERL